MKYFSILIVTLALFVLIGSIGPSPRFCYEMDTQPSFIQSERLLDVVESRRDSLWNKSFTIVGRVIMSVDVSRDGILHNAQVVRGLCPYCDSISVGTWNGIGGWKPAEVSGSPVECRMYVNTDFM